MRSSQQYFSKNSLKAGDIIFTMPLHPVALAVASIDGLPWSHVAIVRDRKTVVEASPGGARSVKISEYVKKGASVNHIDAFRPVCAHGLCFENKSIRQMRLFLDQSIGTNFPMFSMLQLYFVQQLTTKINSPMISKTFYKLCSFFLRGKKNRMMCSVLAMRALRQLNPSDNNWPRVAERDMFTGDQSHNFGSGEFISVVKQVISLLAPKLAKNSNKFLASETLRDFLRKTRENVLKNLSAGQARILMSKDRPQLVFISDLLLSPDIHHLGQIKMSK